MAFYEFPTCSSPTSSHFLFFHLGRVILIVYLDLASPRLDDFPVLMFRTYRNLFTLFNMNVNFFFLC